MDPILNNFDDFVDDLLSSEVDLLKGELDFLVMQHLFNSLDLQTIKIIQSQDKDTFAA